MHNFYWIKLPCNFFELPAVKAMLLLEDGAKIVNFYIELMLRAIKNNCLIEFYKIKSNIAQELASSSDLSEEQIQKMIDLLEKTGSIQILGNGSLFFDALDELTHN